MERSIRYNPLLFGATTGFLSQMPISERVIGHLYIGLRASNYCDRADSCWSSWWRILQDHLGPHSMWGRDADRYGQDNAQIGHETICIMPVTIMVTLHVLLHVRGALTLPLKSATVGLPKTTCALCTRWLLRWSSAEPIDRRRDTKYLLIIQTMFPALAIGLTTPIHLQYLQ